jgi:hypothetical protein
VTPAHLLISVAIWGAFCVVAFVMFCRLDPAARRIKRAVREGAGAELRHKGEIGVGFPVLPGQGMAPRVPVPDPVTNEAT